MSSLDLLNPSIVRDADVLGARFAANAPFPHIVLDDFLTERAARRLLDGFPAFERGNFTGDDGRPGPKSTHAALPKLGAPYAELDRVIQSAEFLQFMSRLTRIEGLLYDPFYLGGGTHENRDGASLDPHVDFNYHPSERWHRRLNLLLYLNPEWRAEWGGCLQLFADPRHDAAPAVSVPPAFNRCVIFETSERSWHGVDRIALPAGQPLSRKSIALYFYTRDRPAAEIAERHTTLYVHPPLPERFTAGRVLTADDVEELRASIERRDRYIDQQHAENTRLRKAQEHGLAGQVLYLMKRAYVRFRR
jgi:hypothetical protein